MIRTGMILILILRMLAVIQYPAVETHHAVNILNTGHFSVVREGDTLR